VNTDIIRDVSYDHRAFDYRDVFLVDENGKPDKEKAAKFATAEAWEGAQVDQTKNDFADIDYNNLTSAAQDKVQAIAATVLQKVKRAVKVYNPLPLIFQMDKGELGKTIEAHEITGGKVYNYTYGGVRRVSSLKHTTYTVSTSPKAVHFQLPVQQMKSGRFTTAELVFSATQAILRDKLSLAYNTLVAAYPTSGSYVGNASSSAITATLLNAGIKSVKNYDAGGLTIIGRSSSLDAINDFNTASTSVVGMYSDAALEEVRKKGFLSVYRGADVIRFPYVVDDVYGTEPWGTASIFILSKERGYNRFVEVGGIEKRAWIDPATGTFNMIFEFEDGAAIWKTKYGYRIYGIA